VAAVNSGFRFTQDFLCRAGLAALLVGLTHLGDWYALKAVTTEAVLRASAWIGLDESRISFDTLRIGRTPVHFVISCTFVDVFAGAIPLLWNRRRSIAFNLSCLAAAGAGLFVFNVVRLEAGHALYLLGWPWVLTDGVLGGVAYFSVWMVIWSLRTWHLVEPAGSARGRFRLVLVGTVSVLQYLRFPRPPFASVVVLRNMRSNDCRSHSVVAAPMPRRPSVSCISLRSG
jgi:hypothetical protein